MNIQDLVGIGFLEFLRQLAELLHGTTLRRISHRDVLCLGDTRPWRCEHQLRGRLDWGFLEPFLWGFENATSALCIAPVHSRILSPGSVHQHQSIWPRIKRAVIPPLCAAKGESVCKE
jgi:hypothetical protein